MKRLLLTFITFVAIGLSPMSHHFPVVRAQSGDVQVISYDASDEDFPNPERGFYRQEVPLANGTERRPLSVAYLNRLRPDGLSLAKLTYVIDEFRTTPISQEVPTRAVIGQPFTSRIRLVNDGFAAPYNSRTVQITEPHSGSGRTS